MRDAKNRMVLPGSSGRGVAGKLDEATRSQFPRVEIHEFDCTAVTAQAKFTSPRRIGGQSQPLHFLIIALYDRLAAFHGDAEPLKTAGRGALQTDLSALAVYAAQMRHRFDRFLSVGGFSWPAIQDKFRITKVFFCPQYGF